MRFARLGVAAVAVSALVPLTATAASAATPPGNDKPAGAVALNLGDTYPEDTSAATTGSFDATLNEVCGAPYTNASVWFTYTPKSDGAFLLDMSASDYEGGIMVFARKPSQGTFRGCGPEELAINGKAGRKYAIMVFSDSTTKGGNLSLSLEKGPPPPTFSATMNSTGRAYQDGRASITGSFTCTNSSFTYANGTLLQIWKRVKILGYYGKDFDSSLCDSTSHSWRKVVTSDNGLYAAGDASATFVGHACGLVRCVHYAMTPQDLTLKGKGGKALLAGTTRSPAATITYTDRPIRTWGSAPLN